MSGFISNERFGRMVFNELLRVCHSWDPSMTPSSGGPVPVEVSVHAIKNTRRKMEDKHVILPMFGKLFPNLVSLPLMFLRLVYFSIFFQQI